MVTVKLEWFCKSNARYSDRNYHAFVTKIVSLQPIIDSVISGNYSLAHVLAKIYSVNRDPIKNHVMTLVSILPNCENTEILALLNLFSLIAKDSSAVRFCVQG